MQRTRLGKTYIKNNNNVERLTLPGFKIYYKGVTCRLCHIVTPFITSWIRDGHLTQNGTFRFFSSNYLGL